MYRYINRSSFVHVCSIVFLDFALKLTMKSPMFSRQRGDQAVTTTGQRLDGLVYWYNVEPPLTKSLSRFITPISL